MSDPINIKKTAEIMRAISNILVILESLSTEERATVLAGALNLSGTEEFLRKRNPALERDFMDLMKKHKAASEG